MPHVPMRSTLEAGCDPGQLVKMAEHVGDCSITLNAEVPGHYRYLVSTYYHAILVDRKVPGHLLAETLLSALDHLKHDYPPTVRDADLSGVRSATVTVLRPRGNSVLS